MNGARIETKQGSNNGRYTRARRYARSAYVTESLASSPLRPVCAYPRTHLGSLAGDGQGLNDS